LLKKKYKLWSRNSTIFVNKRRSLRRYSLLADRGFFFLYSELLSAFCHQMTKWGISSIYFPSEISQYHTWGCRLLCYILPPTGAFMKHTQVESSRINFMFQSQKNSGYFHASPFVSVDVTPLMGCYPLIQNMCTDNDSATCRSPLEGMPGCFRLILLPFKMYYDICHIYFSFQNIQNEHQLTNNVACRYSCRV
jgi:hypothetical protein